MTKKQTSLVIAEPRDRIDKNLIIDFSDFNKPIPDVGIFDEPTRCHRINREWSKLVFGFLDILTDVKAWNEAVDERYIAVQAIQNFMVGEDCVPPEPPSQGCIHYPTYHSSIRYLPVNPYTDPDTIPDGYLDKPFYIYLGGDPFPVNDLYDITVRLTAIPADLGFFNLINGNFPQIIITVQGIGEAEIILQNRPFGGSCAITIDRPLNAFDMFIDGIIDTGAIFIGLNQDITSFPGESVVSKEISLEFEEDGIHEIHLTFIPEYDDSLPIFYFGGVFKGYNLCNLTPVTQGENIVNDIRVNGCNIEALIDGNWIVKGSILACVTGITDPIQDEINGINLTLYQNSLERQTLQAQIASNDGDIAQLVLGQQSQQLQVESNDADILTLQGLVSANNDLIDINAQRIDINDTRLDVLEAAGGGGAGAGVDIITTNYSIVNNSDYSITNSAPYIVSGLGVSHQFTYPTALIIVHFPLRNLTTNEGAYGVNTVNGDIGVIAQRLRKTETIMTLASETFYDIDTTQAVEIALAIYTSVGGTARVDKYYPISYTVVEYGIAESPQLQSVVTFDDGGQTYNLPAAQIGSVTVDGISGNSGDCLQGLNIPSSSYIAVEFTTTSGLQETINDIQFDLYSTQTEVALLVAVYVDDVFLHGFTSIPTTNAWFTVNVPTSEFPVIGTTVRVEAIAQNGYTVNDVRLDNLKAIT